MRIIGRGMQEGQFLIELSDEELANIFGVAGPCSELFKPDRELDISPIFKRAQTTVEAFSAYERALSDLVNGGKILLEMVKSARSKTKEAKS